MLQHKKPVLISIEPFNAVFAIVLNVEQKMNLSFGSLTEILVNPVDSSSATSSTLRALNVLAAQCYLCCASLAVRYSHRATAQATALKLQEKRLKQTLCALCSVLSALCSVLSAFCSLYRLLLALYRGCVAIESIQFLTIDYRFEMQALKSRGTVAQLETL